MKPAEKGGSVIVYNISNPDIYTLFVKGEIDGAWVAEPWATILETELGGNRLFFEEDLWPNKQFASVLLIVNSNYAEKNPEIISNFLLSHHKTVNWINENPLETRNIFNTFLKSHLGQSLSNEVVDLSLSNLEITSDPVSDSVYSFAEKADALGYLGRNGYDLSEIFYTIDSNSNVGDGTYMTKLDAKNIVKYFSHDSHKLKALGGVNLKIESGDFVCLVGPSGCGKSTFLRIVAGLEKPDDGQIIFDGRPVSETGPERIMVFQEGALFPWLKVQDNVEFGLKMAGISKEERAKISHRYLDMMQLTKFADSYTYQLSTGMKQRVAIARALVMDPDVLLMDEPFAALDAQTRDLLLVEMQLIWEKTKKTILFVTHNVAEAAVLGTKVAVFSNRPSTIKKEFTNDFPRPRTPEDESLAQFQHDILLELRPEVKKNIE